MRRPVEIEKDKLAMSTIAELTSVFEGIASMRIAQIKNQVLQAQQFFEELWNIYMQLRVDSLFRFGRHQDDSNVINKELLIIITAEGGFSGDIDEKLIKWVLENYKPEKQDIIVIGHHGAVKLAQAGVQFKKYFKLPEKDNNINVTPIIRQVQLYKSTTVYYQTYVSLMIQDVKKIGLSAVVQQQAKGLAKKDVISEQTYIFEPSTFAVVSHLERSMMNIALSQVILESKLAQYASRFQAMSRSHKKADESRDELQLLYSRSKRWIRDERLKEISNGLKKTGVLL